LAYQHCPAVNALRLDRFDMVEHSAVLVPHQDFIAARAKEVFEIRA
jgi:hypothetical protein